MRIALSELQPVWLATGPGREGMGLAWDCPCGRHRMECWLWNPLDRQGPITVMPGVDMRNHHGDSFETISLDWSFRCGHDVLHVTGGEVFQG